MRTPGANHFLNDGPTEQLLAALEACIPERKRWTFRWPTLSGFKLPKVMGIGAPHGVAGA